MNPNPRGLNPCASAPIRVLFYFWGLTLKIEKCIFRVRPLFFPALQKIQQEILRASRCGPALEMFPCGSDGLRMSGCVQFSAQQLHAQEQEVRLQRVRDRKSVV